MKLFAAKLTGDRSINKTEKALSHRAYGLRLQSIFGYLRFSSEMEPRVFIEILNFNISVSILPFIHSFIHFLSSILGDEGSLENKIHFWFQRGAPQTISIYRLFYYISQLRNEIPNQLSIFL